MNRSSRTPVVTAAARRKAEIERLTAEAGQELAKVTDPGQRATVLALLALTTALQQSDVVNVNLGVSVDKLQDSVHSLDCEVERLRLSQN